MAGRQTLASASLAAVASSTTRGTPAWSEWQDFDFEPFDIDFVTFFASRTFCYVRLLCTIGKASSANQASIYRASDTVANPALQVLAALQTDVCRHQRAR
jgi:hypothetical protein